MTSSGKGRFLVVSLLPFSAPPMDSDSTVVGSSEIAHEALLPKLETRATHFIQQHPTYDGQDHRFFHGNMTPAVN